MNPANLTALITAITALIGAIGGLIITLQHMRNHNGSGNGTVDNTTAKSGPVTPAKPDTTQ